MILYFFTVWIVNMILYIKNTMIINDLFMYNLNCQYESSTIYKPTKTHIVATNSTIEFNEDQVLVIVWEITYLRW